MGRDENIGTAMGPDERTFFQTLGERIALLRKEHGLTQVQLAQVLGCSQQQVLSFEKGRRRVPVSTLPTLAKALGVTIEELIGAETHAAKRGPTSKLQRQLEQLSQLPKSRQRFVSQVLDSVLQQGGR